VLGSTGGRFEPEDAVHRDDRAVLHPKHRAVGLSPRQ